MTIKSLVILPLALLLGGATTAAQAQENSLMSSAPYFFFGGQSDGANEFPSDISCIAFNASQQSVRVKMEVRTFKARANRGDISDADPRLRGFVLGPKRVGLLRTKIDTSTASSAQCEVIHNGPVDAIVASIVVEDGADGRGAIAGPVEYIRATTRAAR